MDNQIVTEIKSQLREVDELITEVLHYDFMTDKMYTKIITKIGHIDDVYMKSPAAMEDANYFNRVKTRLDRICEILINVEKNATVSLLVDKEDLMHPSGDYYNEDNSVVLTPDVKEALTRILDEKH